MKPIQILFALCCVGAFQAPAQSEVSSGPPASGAAPAQDSAQANLDPASALRVATDPEYAVVERGPHHNVWERIDYEESPNGKATPVLHRYTELATGLNYTKDGEWAPSVEIVEPCLGGATAKQGQYGVTFANDLATAGAIDMETPDGQRLVSQVLGLSYFDKSTGESTLIAEVRSSQGEIVGSNQVVYADAFDGGFRCDVRYTYRKGRFEQDIVVTEQPPAPEEFGLNSEDGIVLQVLTEFVQHPQVAQAATSAPVSAETALNDATISLGGMKMGNGRAFSVGGSGAGAAVRTGKQLLSLDGRDILVEEVSLRAVGEQLRALPRGQASLERSGSAVRRTASVKRKVPKLKEVAHVHEGGAMKLAQATARPAPGFVIDYQQIIPSGQKYIFRGDTTYFISDGGGAELMIFEGGTVIKFSKDQNASLEGMYAQFLSTTYHPAVFTAKDDDTVGEHIAGSSGVPTGTYGCYALALDNWGNTLQNARFSYSYMALYFQNCAPGSFPPEIIQNVQIAHCQTAICADSGDVWYPDGEGEGYDVSYPHRVKLRNVSMRDVGYAINGCGPEVTAEHLTVDGCTTLGPSPAIFACTNSIFANVTVLGSDLTLSGEANGFYNATAFGTSTWSTSENPFLAVGGGGYYLATNCPFRGKGTVNIDASLLSGIRTKTTWPPLVYCGDTFGTDTNLGPQVDRDTGASPDLGWHYDPLDYAFNGCNAYAEITFGPGTAAGWFGGGGIALGNRHIATFAGSMEAPCYWVRTTVVQEGRPGVWPTSACPGGITGSADQNWQMISLSPEVRTRFTRCSMLAGEPANYFRDNFGYLIVRATDSEFWGGTLGAYGMSLYLTNCLMDRISSGICEGWDGNEIVYRNCTWHGGSVGLTPWFQSISASIRDCAFDGTALNIDTSYLVKDFDYNAFLQNSPHLPGAGGHDVNIPQNVSGGLQWQTGPLGGFYLPSASPLLNHGSQSASSAGLSLYTTQTGLQTQDSGQVDIGYHHVALNSSGNPIDANSDGIPDYIAQPPVIVRQPMSQVKYNDGYTFDPVTFSVVATGTQPMTYQWRRQIPGHFYDPEDIPGATGPSLTLLNPQSYDYSVVVANPLGSVTSADATLTIQNEVGPGGMSLVTLTGSRDDYTFRSDTTYYIDSAVELYGTTTFEGGTVIKYAPGSGAKLVIRGALNLLTGPYSPAIFTAKDDDTCGRTVPGSTGDPTTGYYADPALELPTSDPVQARYVRILFAQTALHFSGPKSMGAADEIRHIQIFHCSTAVRTDGDPPGGSGATRGINLRNVLISRADLALSGSSFGGSAQHTTVEACGTLARDDSQSWNEYDFLNSVLVNVGTFGDGIDVDGNHNGFYNYPAETVQFGDDASSETGWPFAVTVAQDDLGDQYYLLANGQGRLYLREDSPFRGLGTSEISPDLRRALAGMTTHVPQDLSERALDANDTLAPTPIRDTSVTDLGYHYSAVDYAVNTLDLQNCTLSIDPGTAIGFAAPDWTYGINVGPGARLLANGTPTNRITFARLDGVQERLIWYFQAGNIMLTLGGGMLPDGVPVSPFPEARFSCVDFPTISEPYPVDQIDGVGVCATLISALELDSCHLQGGLIFYDTGGPPGRKLTFRNTVFDRTWIGIENTGYYAGVTSLDPEDPTFTAVNNLFHYSTIILNPTQTGDSWTFTDNIFDHAFFPGDDAGPCNGPVGVNHHNAYVSTITYGSQPGRLAPSAPTTTDPTLADLIYETGPLGRFYLPSTATDLLAKGSRSASDAGLYHFTTSKSNVKEGTAANVDIGPHYLALLNGQAPDSNSDGVPDFIADRNGNGAEDTDEMPWQSLNTGGLTILAPTENSTVTGTIQLKVNLGADAANIEEIVPLVDGIIPPESTTIEHPSSSLAVMEIDTRQLEDGTHTFSAEAYSSTMSPTYTFPAEYRTAPVSLTTANSIRFPDWTGIAEENISIKITVPPNPTARLWFATDLGIFNYNDVDSSTGNIDYASTLADLYYPEDGTTITTITELNTTSGQPGEAAVLNAKTTKLKAWPTSSTGKWVVTYEDDGADYFHNPNSRTELFKIADVRDTTGSLPPWLHQNQLSAWLSCGLPPGSGGFEANGPGTSGFSVVEGDPGSLVPPPAGNVSRAPASGQTWPLRFANLNDPAYTAAINADINQLSNYLTQAESRNFYGRGHGSFNLNKKTPYTFLLINPKRFTTGLRYRFAFFDGCKTGLSQELFQIFGATKTEFKRGVRLSQLQEWNGGPLSLGSYPTDEKHRLRPALFLGYKTETVVAIWYDLDTRQVDDATGCQLHSYPALSNWHFATVAYWQVAGYDFVTAAKQAYTDTMVAPLGIFPRPDTSKSVLVPDPDDPRNPIAFTPDACLWVYGFGGLKLNDYNADNSDWPH